MKWVGLLFVIGLCCLVEESRAQSNGFFGALANIFRRGSSTTSTVEQQTIDLNALLAPQTQYVTDYSTLTLTETETMTETETSTMSLSWLRWTTETEREFITETVTETSTTVDVSLIVSVAVVTLTEKSTSFMTTTSTLVSATTRTIYSDLVFTEPAPKCPTYTVTVQPHKPFDAIEIDIDDIAQRGGSSVDPLTKVDIDDLDLVEGFLTRSSGSLRYSITHY